MHTSGGKKLIRKGRVGEKVVIGGAGNEWVNMFKKLCTKFTKKNKRGVIFSQQRNVYLLKH